MKKDNEDLIDLFDRISNGQASDEDIAEYNRWCHAFQAKRIPVPDIDGITTEMLERIKKQIHDTSRISRIKLWTKLAAAAFIAAAFIISANFLVNKPQTKEITQTEPKQEDIAPGGNKATLTLANGQKIILDDVQNGQLATVGNGKVSKVNNGLIAYQGQANASSKIVPVQYNTLTVPRGGQYQLILPDGTKVWLNAASSIRFPTAFTGKERKVAITGEVYMEVAKDALHPFIVTTRHSDIMVLGTSFNVMAYGNEAAVKTTLLEGSVKVTIEGDKVPVILKPGEQASVRDSSENIRVKKVIAEDAASWIHGMLSLNDEGVREFMDQLSRWYNVDIEYTGEVPAKKFGGLINRNANLSDVLSALDAAGIQTRLEGKKIIVL